MIPAPMPDLAPDIAARDTGPTGLAALRLAARLALRDLRGGIGGFRIVLLCLALGVAAIGAVGGLRAMIQDGIADQQRTLLGGDLAVESSDPLPDALSRFVTAHGGRIAHVLRMRSMLYAPHAVANGTASGRMLVEIEAVDAAYPLVGAVASTPSRPSGQPLFADTDPPGVLAEPIVIDRLGLKPGDVLRIGAARFRLAGTLTHSPDNAGGVVLAPTVMMDRRALDAAGLLQVGALANRSLRIALDGPDMGRSARAAELARAIARQFPDQGWRIRGVADAAPGLTRTIDQVAQFMSLTGLTALLLGGLGVSAGVASWLEGRGCTIAVLRCLGAPARLISLTFGLQIMGLCGVGIAAGMAAGLLLPSVGVHALAGLLPVAPARTMAVRPVLLAGLFGALVAAFSAILPLMRAAATPPAALFHDQGRRPGLDRAGRIQTGGALAACAILLGLLAEAMTPGHLFVAGFLGVALAAAGALALAGLGLRRLVGRMVRHMGTEHGVLRLGLALFAQPGAPTARLVVALGAGLAGMATIVLVEGAIMAQLRDQLPRHAPSFYFVDIQPDDLDRFDSVARAQPSVSEIRQLPSMRTRIVAIDGVPAERVPATPQTQWALRGDHGLTLSATPPPGTQLAAGAWWPADYAGPPLLSLDAGLAAGWGVKIGSVVRLNVLGRSLDFRVANLRTVAWRSLQLNFAFVVSPGLLSHAPHTFVATVTTSGRPDQDAAVLAAVTDTLPGVTGIRVADVLAELGTLVGRLAVALAAAASVVLASGGLVLAATLAAGWRQRVATAATLRALGADAGQIRSIWLVEFIVLGLAAGLCAAGLGTLIAWLVTRGVLHLPWTGAWTDLALTLSGTLVAMIGSGMLFCRRALRAAGRTRS
ncbi:putative permease protein [Gluconacetobacter johannae DSM 13595]|nr:FtsX-like permease family protein [Gluconacetobacter johannae]GBQ82376.1 putative permease protein [Gluconacetobacter johannae DSM 13595]